MIAIPISFKILRNPSFLSSPGEIKIITFDSIRKNFNRYLNELRKRIEICPLTKLFRSSNIRQGQSHRHDTNQRSENTQHRRSFVSCNVNKITKLSNVRTNACSVQHRNDGTELRKIFVQLFQAANPRHVNIPDA